MSGTRRLLVITYHFGAEGSVGGLRWYGFTKYLERLGWTSAVLTAAEPNGGAARVERCPRFLTCLDALRSVRDLMRRGRATGSADSTPAPAPSRAGILRHLGRELIAWLALPDESRGWILRATLRARALIRRFQPDVVVSSGPPHAAHLVAGLALAGSRVRWVIDLRDPWAGPLPAIWESHRILGSRSHRILSRNLERLAFRAAAAVLTTTPQLAEVLATQYPHARIVCVPNGVDPERLPRAQGNPYPGVSLAYTGTLYGGRDIGAVVRGLGLFLKRHPDAARAGARLRVAGAVDSHHARALAETVAAAGMGECIELLGMLPRTDALQVLARSRLAVILAQEQELQIPAKLYEAVAMGIPTLVLAPEGTATATEARRLGAMVHDSNDVEGIARLLERLWRDGAALRPRCPVDITHETLAVRMDALLRSDLITASQAAPHSTGGAVKGAKR